MTATNKTFAILSDIKKSQIKTVILENCGEQRNNLSRIPFPHQPQPFYQFNLACKLKEILDIFLHFVTENYSMTAANKTFAILSDTQKSQIKNVILENCGEQRNNLSRIPFPHQPQPFYQFNLACKLKEIQDILLHFVTENSSMTATNKTFTILSDTKKSQIKNVILENCGEQRNNLSRTPFPHQPQPFYQCNLASKLKEILDIFLHFDPENYSMTAANKTFAILSDTKKVK